MTCFLRKTAIIFKVVPNFSVSGSCKLFQDKNYSSTFSIFSLFFFKMHLALEIWNWWKFFHHCCTSFVNPVLTILKIEFVFAPLQPTSCRNVLESFKMSRSFPGMIRTIVLFIFKPFILKVNFPLYDFWVNLF